MLLNGNKRNLMKQINIIRNVNDYIEISKKT